MPELVKEIKEGGVKGAFGFDQWRWDGQAGAVHEIWIVKPCCGDPDIKGACYCLGCWICCGCCSSSKLFASSLSQDCAVLPHILLVACCGCCVAPVMRYNLRKKAGQKGNIIGDAMCAWCCFSSCSWCQQLRSVEVKEWDWLHPFKVEAKAPEIKLLV